MKKISIIIVTYNSTKDIRGCLNSIYDNNDIGEELEVIVVDNKSKDIASLKEIISVDFPQVILIENTQNGGYGQGNNVGIKQSTAPIIMIMNPDVRLFKPIFSHAIEQYRKRPLLMLLGMQQYNKKDVKGASFLLKIPTFSSLFLYKICSKLNIYIAKLFFISGACFFLRKDDFLKIGGFDEKIFLYGEETDINERILNNNYQIRFDGSIGYIHPMHERGDSLVAMQRGMKSALYICDKYGWPKIKIVKTYIRYYRLLLKRSIKRNDNNQSEAYTGILEYLDATLNELKSICK